MTKVAVVGAGLIGRAWAISFARAGHEVAITDADAAAAEKALSFIDEALKDLQRFDLLNGAAPAEVRGRLRAARGLEDALEGAIHVQENAPERIEVKRALYGELDRIARPETVLASSTSALLPSAFTEALKGRARCLVAHPINPPYLVPAVEIVPAPWTDPAVVERTAEFMRAAGQAPIIMTREIDGFVVNRLQGALLQEAFRLVADGYASCEDVDIALREGLALRWSFMGPFETIDLNAPGGAGDYIRRYSGLYDGLFESQRRRADWQGPVMGEIERQRRQRVKTEDLERRQAWRDRRLMALAAHKRVAAKDIGE
jgi:3-hydroxyacyl-CoA dehydrogenase